MGDAKKKGGGGPFHMTKREQFLFLFFVMNKPSKDRQERRTRRHMWSELGLVEAREKIVELPPPAEPGQKAPEVGIKAWDWRDNTDPIPVTISGATMDYMIDVLAGQQQGGDEVVLGELEDRLFSLRDGGYKVPDGLFPELKSVPGDAAG